jgi:phospholipase/lecithinase/hemolysin
MSFTHSLLKAFLLIQSSILVLATGCGKSRDITPTPGTSDVSSQFQAVVVFGDSLSDNGNLKYLTSQFADVSPKLSGHSIPISPEGDKSGYYNGRFSNGPNWIDQLVGALNLPFQKAETCFLKGTKDSCNYAIGGSTTDERLSSDSDPFFKDIKDLFANTDVEPIIEKLKFKIPQHIGVKQMVRAYTQQPIIADSSDLNHTLFVLWAGGNDYFAKEKSSTTVANLISSIKYIINYNNPNHEKRYFLIPNLPDLGAIPFAREHTDLNLAEATSQHNLMLQEQLKTEILDNSEFKDRAVIIYVDMYGAFVDAMHNPTQYNITNTKDACYNGGYMPGSESNACSNASEYLFWDKVHPTTKAHCIAAKTALLAMAAVNLLDKPEIANDFSCLRNTYDSRD